MLIVTAMVTSLTNTYMWLLCPMANRMLLVRAVKSSKAYQLRWWPPAVYFYRLVQILAAWNIHPQHGNVFPLNKTNDFELWWWRWWAIVHLILTNSISSVWILQHHITSILRRAVSCMPRCALFSLYFSLLLGDLFHVIRFINESQFVYHLRVSIGIEAKRCPRFKVTRMRKSVHSHVR